VEHVDTRHLGAGHVGAEHVGASQHGPPAGPDFTTRQGPATGNDHRGGNCSGDGSSADITVELELADAPERDPARDLERDPAGDATIERRAIAGVYITTPGVPRVRRPVLRRPPVLLAVLAVLLATAATAGLLGARGGTEQRRAEATGTLPAVAPQVVASPGVSVAASVGGTRTPAASAHARTSTSPSASPAGSGSVPAGVPVVPAGDRLREVLPLVVNAPGCPGQTFGGSCYSVQPFTLPLSVVVPAGFDEARLADALQWTVRTDTVLGPVAFHARGNHTHVTVTDRGQATPPTIWTVQAALTVSGVTHLSDEITLRVYATT
jgi:hypothetical protein